MNNNTRTRLRNALVLVIGTASALFLACASDGTPKIDKADCVLWTDTAANVAEIIANETAKVESRREAVTLYAELFRAASAAGCPGAVPPPKAAPSALAD